MRAIMQEQNQEILDFSDSYSQEASRQFLRNQWLMLACALFVIFLFLGYQSITHYRQIAEQEQNRLRTQARVVSSIIESHLEAANLAMKSLVGDYDLLMKHKSDMMANRHMSELSDAMPGVRTMLILNADGDVIASNRDVLISQNFRSRDYFTIPAKENNPDVLYVSPPFKSVLGVYVINISKVIQTADGRFKGVIAVSLDPAYFKVLLGSVLYAPDMRSAVNHGDGIRFMSMPETVGDSGKNLMLPGTFTMQHRDSGKVESMFTGKTATYSKERVEVMRTISTKAFKMNKPLYVECSRDVSAVYQDWRYTTFMQALIFICISLISIFGLLILQGRQKNLIAIADNAQYFMNIRLKLLDISMTHDIENFLRLALDELSAFSGSPIGFYHFVAPDQKSLSLQAWSTRTANEFCNAEGKGLHYSVEKAGVWADCVRHKRPVIHNNYPSLPDRKGLPEGHVEIIRELVVPVIRSGMVVATMGLGNKATAYNETDLKQTSYLADVVWEIIERKRIEERCSLMAMIVEQSPLSVVMTDTDANITYVNHFFEQLTGYSAEEVKGHNPRILKTEITRQEIFNEMWNSLKSGYDWEGELCNKKKDGTQYWEKAHLFPIFSREGEVVQFAGIKEDITTRKLFEEELKLAKSQAEAASRAKSEFLANMSHEIRTPMNAITGISYLVLKTDLDQQQRDYLNKIRNAADSLLGIINDVLDFSKIEAGRLELEHLDFSLSDILEKIGDQVVLKAEEKGNEILLSIAPEIPSRLVGDPLRLGQVINNLVSNAVKFTEQGRIAVTVAPVSRVGTENIELVFKVSDTGIGMSQEHIERIFAPFEQADSSTTRKYGGTGLGLTIVKRLVELMGGTLQVESEEGVGSTFSFTVSLGLSSIATSPNPSGIVERMKKNAVADNASAQNAQVNLGIDQLAGLRVLIVEDNSINREIMLEMLKQVGVMAECAFDGQEAVDKVASSAGFDAVLMDLQMPIMDGYQATGLIRQMKSAEDLPIIAITAHVMAKDRERCLAAGMDGHVSKPVYAEELYTALLHSIENSRRTKFQANTKPHNGLSPDMLQLPGIVVERLLERINGNPELLRNLLIAFRSQNLSTVTGLRQALAADDRNMLMSMSHALKGVAANIGAENLSATVSKFEDAVKAGNTRLFAGLLDALEHQMGEVFEAARILEKYDTLQKVTVGDASGEPTDTMALEKVIAELYDLLSRNKVSALEKFNHLKQICPEHPECLELESLITSFDYKRAKKSLLKLAEKFGVAIEVRQ